MLSIWSALVIKNTEYKRHRAPIKKSKIKIRKSKWEVINTLVEVGNPPFSCPGHRLVLTASSYVPQNLLQPTVKHNSKKRLPNHFPPRDFPLYSFLFLSPGLPFALAPSSNHKTCSNLDWRAKCNLTMKHHPQAHMRERGRKRDYLAIFQYNTLLELYIAANHRTLDRTTIRNGDVIHNNWISNLNKKEENPRVETNIPVWISFSS